MEEVSERTHRTYLILFNTPLCLGHLHFVYVFSKAIRAAPNAPDCLISSFHSTWILGNILAGGFWICCVAHSGAGCLCKSLQEGHSEQEGLSLIEGRSLFSLTLLPREQD